LPESFNVDEKAKGPRWIEAIYFSGITLTTLGYTINKKAQPTRVQPTAALSRLPSAPSQ
jgi:hypothetical protein